MTGVERANGHKPAGISRFTILRWQTRRARSGEAGL